MFERYTEPARRVIFFARYEASQFGSTTIESEHMLLGLVREDSLMRRFLPNTSALDIRRKLAKLIAARKKVSTAMDLPLTDECKRILTYAHEESECLAHSYIGTEHLLLGTLREEACLSARILTEEGLSLAATRDELAESPRDPGDLGQPPNSSFGERVD